MKGFTEVYCTLATNQGIPSAGKWGLTQDWKRITFKTELAIYSILLSKFLVYYSGYWLHSISSLINTSLPPGKSRVMFMAILYRLLYLYMPLLLTPCHASPTTVFKHRTVLVWHRSPMLVVKQHQSEWSYGGQPVTITLWIWLYGMVAFIPSTYVCFLSTLH